MELFIYLRLARWRKDYPEKSEEPEKGIQEFNYLF